MHGIHPRSSITLEGSCLYFALELSPRVSTYQFFSLRTPCVAVGPSKLPMLLFKLFRVLLFSIVRPKFLAQSWILVALEELVGHFVSFFGTWCGPRNISSSAGNCCKAAPCAVRPCRRNARSDCSCWNAWHLPGVGPMRGRSGTGRLESLWTWCYSMLFRVLEQHYH